MLTNETNNVTQKRPLKKRFSVFKFILRWWFSYGVFGGIAFVCGIAPFVNLFCSDFCQPRDFFSGGLFDLLITLFFSVGTGAILGAIVGSIVGIIHAAIIRFWITYPTQDIQLFRRKTIYSNLLIPSGLMVFSTIFLVSLTKNVSELPAVLYTPILAYSIAVIVGLLVSRKFLKWYIPALLPPLK